ncbi:MAG: NAD-dependent malic enzyme [Pseudomonadota bacterium]|nr:NAD-dependent malic enzyme [Pseudomonadota bacterium]
MLKLKLDKDPKSGESYMQTNLSGKALLTTPQLNKSTAFTLEERHAFGLLGKLPASVETLEEQAMRSYLQYSSFQTALQKSIFLHALHDTNGTLFYKLVSAHMAEMIPVLYTPIVGVAVATHSIEFRRPRGLYISFPDMDYMEEILNNRTNPEIDVIVTTDGESILGIGDQGIGGIDIPIAKLMVYTIAAGINPLRTLPIMLDVGTNNQELLDNPMYLGWRHKRITGEQYDTFINRFVTAVKKVFPNVYLHWEDFGRDNAQRNLDTYRDTICSFNDDIQGTGVVTLAALLAAVHTSKSQLTHQRIVIYGAGSAGIGIAEQICDAMVRSGLSSEEAHGRFWLINSTGLITTAHENLSGARKRFAHDVAEIAAWQVANPKFITLKEVVSNLKPTVLIGSSTIFGAFTQDIIETMANNCERPIIFPLSNPTEHSEATPTQLMEWTKGKALIATGSPFDPVVYNNKTYAIGQCNNALVFPGIGLGIMAVKAKKLSDDMLWAACEAIAGCAPSERDEQAPLLPALQDARPYSRIIARAVAKQAIIEGLAQVDANADVDGLLDAITWEPRYVPYKKS